MRDIRTVNMAEGQKIESDKVIKRIGDIGFRNLGTLAKIGLLDDGKALITKGLRVQPSSGMTVQITAGNMLQRLTSGDVLPCVSIDAETVTLDAASGVNRIDIIECQIKSVTDKDDTASFVLDSSTGVISVEELKRDIKYYLAFQKKTSTTTASAATAGVLSGTVGIPGTIDLSSNYLLNLSDGEDGSFQEIDLRGATPEATTAAEIVSAINAAVGRVMASVGGGNVLLLTGTGTGRTSYFEIKPPVSNSDADALQTVFGVSSAGAYNYVYKGEDEWIKLAEIDVGTVTTIITSGLIRNIDNKSTWASDSENVIVRGPLYNPSIEPRVGSTTKIEQEYIEISEDHPWFCLSLPDQILSTSNFPSEFINKRRNKKITYDEMGTPVSAYSGSWSSNVFTLTDNAANNALLTALAQDWLFAGSPTSDWRILNDGTTDFNITDIDVATRQITVNLDGETATGTSISIYLNREYRSPTECRHFSEAGLASYQAGSDKFNGLRRLDQMQGHWHSLTIRASGDDGGILSPIAIRTTITGTETNMNTPNEARSLISDGINGTPRTGDKTEVESGTEYKYIYTGSYTA